MTLGYFRLSHRKNAGTPMEESDGEFGSRAVWIKVEKGLQKKLQTRDGLNAGLTAVKRGVF